MMCNNTVQHTGDAVYTIELYAAMPLLALNTGAVHGISIDFPYRASARTLYYAAESRGIPYPENFSISTAAKWHLRP